MYTPELSQTNNHVRPVVNGDQINFEITLGTPEADLLTQAGHAFLSEYGNGQELHTQFLDLRYQNNEAFQGRQSAANFVLDPESTYAALEGLNLLQEQAVGARKINETIGIQPTGSLVPTLDEELGLRALQLQGQLIPLISEAYADR